MVLGIGSIIGIAAALGVGRFFRAVLYGISPKDPATFLIATALMCLVAVAACILPAQRALAIDPTTALRDE